MKGTAGAGEAGGLAVIDRDLRAGEPASIRDAKVLLTMVGGRVVYEQR